MDAILIGVETFIKKDGCPAKAGTRHQMGRNYRGTWDGSAGTSPRDTESRILLHGAKNAFGV
jgi:hypothetical protein